MYFIVKISESTFRKAFANMLLSPKKKRSNGIITNPGN